MFAWAIKCWLFGADSAKSRLDGWIQMLLFSTSPLLCKPIECCVLVLNCALRIFQISKWILCVRQCVRRHTPWLCTIFPSCKFNWRLLCVQLKITILFRPPPHTHTHTHKYTHFTVGVRVGTMATATECMWMLQIVRCHIHWMIMIDSAFKWKWWYCHFN